MPDIVNIKKLFHKLKQLEKDAKKASGASVDVGYSQTYSIFVHEMMGLHHRVGQAKFLEQPSRQLGNIMTKIIVNAMRSGKSLEEGLLLAGLRLQRESMDLCPMLTGALRASAYTAYTRNSAQEAERAFARSEAIRLAATQGRKKHKR